MHSYRDWTITCRVEMGAGGLYMASACIAASPCEEKDLAFELPPIGAAADEQEAERTMVEYACRWIDANY